MPATDVYWRNLRKMHIWFALSSLLLIVATIWMLGDDHRREYFDHQRTFYRIQALKAQAKIDEIQDAAFQKKKKQLETEIAAARDDLQARDYEVEEARDKLDAAELDLTLAEKKLKLLNSRLGVARADFDLAVRDERGKAVIDRLKAAYDDLDKQVNAQKLEVERVRLARDKAKDELSAYTRRLDELQAALKELTKNVDLLRKSKLQVAPEGWLSSTKRKIMEWPIIQGFNSHLHVRQDWLPDLKIKLGMTETARFDRCRTCHLGADHVEAGNIPAYPHGRITQKEADEFHAARLQSGETPKDKWGPNDPRLWVAKNQFPHPYATHPNPDLYLTSSSPHKAATFGCTICHDGNGSGTSFQHAEHGPNSPFQAGQWKKKHHYHSNHFWEYPMQPKRLLQSTCLKCHHQVEELGTHPKFGSSAPKVFKGYRLIQRYGCFGCHEIHGYEENKSLGPDLRLEPNYTDAALQFRWLVDKQVERLIASKKNNGSVRPVGLVKEQFDYLQALEHYKEQTKKKQNGDAAKKPGDGAKKKSPAAKTAGPAMFQPSPPAFHGLLDHIINEPDNSANARSALSDMIQRDVQARSNARRELSRQRGLSAEQRAQSQREIELNYLSLPAAGLADQLKDVAHPGKYRKVGPSLRYIASKVPKDFIPYWTEEPKRFRPSTRMPQFFKLTNLQDAHGAQLSAAELIAIAEYLYAKSQDFKFLPIHPKAEPPDAKRGKLAFEERGCVACHSHKNIQGANPDYGPDLTLIAAKVKRDKYNDQSQQANFSHWLYTWIRNPHRYHKRSRMPYLFLDELKEDSKLVEGKKETKYYDVAADITAYLLSAVADEAKAKQQAYQQRTAELRKTGLKHVDELIKRYLVGKALTSAQFDQLYQDRRYPITDTDRIKGDEIELVQPSGKAFTKKEFEQAKLRYLGRRTISRYGCYACHDIPGLERARPIGTTLQDWGRKDRTKLAFEHIAEYLKHHGERDGESTAKRARLAVLNAASGDEDDDKQAGLAVAFFYESILHHGRPGFIWQKLRAPRSYDYEKIETKNYDERLRMPKFPFNEQEIEQVATFVLGLVAEPPATEYLYQPSGPPAARVEGERLLQKYNCTGCHMVELPRVTMWADTSQPPFGPSKEKKPAPFGTKLLHEMMPPRKVDTSITRTVEVRKKPVKQTRMSFHGLRVFSEKEGEDLYLEPTDVFENWEHLEINGFFATPSQTRVAIRPADLVSIDPGRGGNFAEWLFATLKGRLRFVTADAGDLYRQQVPPVLYREGYKVQTPWLYHFLRNPHRLRPMVVLRMPRFNMSAAEAQSLANYFAAVDGQSYPYQAIPQRKPAYAERKTRELWDLIKDTEHPDYLAQAWRQLTNPAVCRKCHSVGGYPMGPQTDPKAVRGPNLKYAVDRLRPNWLLLWLGMPTYVTPYTGMPQNFVPGTEIRPEQVFHNNPHVQWIATRDALMNYHQLMDRFKNTTFKYPVPTKKEPMPNPAPPVDLSANHRRQQHPPSPDKPLRDRSKAVEQKKAILNKSQTPGRGSD